MKITKTTLFFRQNDDYDDYIEKRFVWNVIWINNIKTVDPTPVGWYNLGRKDNLIVGHLAA